MQRDAQAKRNRRLILARVTLVAVGFVVGLAIAEASLRIAEKIHARRQFDSTKPYVREDSELGRIVLPNAPDHDANGFRNVLVPQRADIVTLGDSQTWGVNAQRPDAWPQTLGRLAGRSVYNMGVPGYGPVQYWLLSKRALELSPRTLVIGLFLGNDLSDAHRRTYGSESHAELRIPNPPPVLFDDVIFRQNRSLERDHRLFLQQFGDTTSVGWRLWLRGHTAVGRLLDRALLRPGHDAWTEIERQWAEKRSDEFKIYDRGGVVTLLSISQVRDTTNLDDPRTAEGLRITLELLSRIQADAAKAGTRVLLLFIPSKESVFYGPFKQQNGVDPVYEQLMQNELRTRAAVIARGGAEGMEHVDARPALVEAVGRGEQICSVDSDGHYLPRGYAIIAATVNEKLRQLNW